MPRDGRTDTQGRDGRPAARPAADRHLEPARPRDAGGELLKEYLEAAGVACELAARDPDRANLIARIPGTGEGPSLALLGHTDVVPADAEDWQHPPFAAHARRRRLRLGPGRGRHEERDGQPRRDDGRAGPLRLPAAGRPACSSPRRTRRTAPQDVGMGWLVRGAARTCAPTTRSTRAAASACELADGRVVVTINVGEKATLPLLVDGAGRGRPRLDAHVGRERGASAGDADHAAGRAPHARGVLLPETRAMLETLVGPFGDDLDGAIERACALHAGFPTLLPAAVRRSRSRPRGCAARARAT